MVKTVVDRPPPQKKTKIGKKTSKNFCLTYFSKLNRDPIEKPLYRFEDHHC